MGTPDRPASIAARATQGMAPLPGALPALGPFATPEEGGGVSIPTPDRGRQPPHDLHGILGVLACQSPMHQDTLHRLGKIQLGAPQGGVQGRDASLGTPLHQVQGVVALKIVPD